MITMQHEEPDRSAASIIEFCRFARDNGLYIGVQQTFGAVGVAKTIGAADREELAFALRAVLTSSKEEWERFHELFEIFWSASRRAQGSPLEESKEARFRTHRPQASSRALLAQSANEASSADREGKDVSGASAQQRLQSVDLSDVPGDDLAALEQISAHLFRKMSLRLSRRRHIQKLADRVDVGRAHRRRSPPGGAAIEPALHRE